MLDFQALKTKVQMVMGIAQYFNSSINNLKIIDSEILGN